MNILQANKFYYLKGGAERYYFDLSALLNEKGHRVVPFAMENIKNKPTPYHKYFVSQINIGRAGYSLNDIKSAGRILYSFEAKNKINRLLDTEKIDIAHIHNIYHQISPSILTAIKARKIPIVMTVHDFKLMCPVYSFYTQGEVCERCKKHKYYNGVRNKCTKNSYIASSVNMMEMYLHRMMKMYRNNIDLYICPSKFVRDKMIDFGWPRKKIITLPHFVETKDLENDQDRGNYALYFGRLINNKGVMDLLRAYQYLKNDYLKIAGTGPQEKEYRDFVRKNNLKNVEFLGHLAREELNKKINRAKYVIVPSKSYETFGLTVTEAFNQARAVIAADIGALPELVKNDINGYIFQPGDWRDLKNKIIDLNEDEARLKEMGEKGKEYVRKNLNPEYHYERLFNEYKKLIK